MIGQEASHRLETAEKTLDRIWRQNQMLYQDLPSTFEWLLLVSAVVAPVPAGQGPGLETAYLQLVG